MFEKKSFLSIYQIATSNVVSQVAANLYYYFWMISVELISKSTQEKLYEMNPHFNFYELKHIWPPQYSWNIVEGCIKHPNPLVGSLIGWIKFKISIL